MSFKEQNVCICTLMYDILELKKLLEIKKMHRNKQLAIGRLRFNGVMKS